MSLSQMIDKSLEDTQVQEKEHLVRGLEAAIVGIPILGHLNLIACKIDFPLQRTDQAQEFKLLYYPKSFRACLTQVSNLGQMAFLKAHTSMDNIAAQTNQVPNYIKEIHEIITEGEEEELEEVAISLRAIERIVENCKDTTKDVVIRFELVMLTLSELQEACCSRTGDVESAIQSLALNAKVNETENANRDELNRQIESECHKLREKLEEESKLFKQSLEDLTSGKTLLTQIGLGFADVLTSKVVPMMAAAGSIAIVGCSLSTPETLGMSALGLYGMKKAMNKDNASGEKEEVDTKETHSTPCELQCVILPQLKNALESVGSFFEMDGETIKVKPLTKQEDYEKKKETFRQIKDKTDEAEDGGSDKKMAKGMRQVCNEAKKLCQKISSTKNICDAGKLHSNLNELIAKANEIRVGDKSKAANFGTNLMSGVSGGVAETYARNMSTRVQLTREELQKTKEDLDKSKERQMENNRKMQETMLKLECMKIEESNQTQVLEVLKEGLDAFAQLKEQWTHLLLYFEKVSQMIKVCMQAPMVNFKEKAEHYRGILEEGGRLTNRQKRSLSLPAMEALKGACQIHTNALIYLGVSKKFFQPMLSQLGTFLALDADKDSSKVAEKQNAIKEKAREAQLFLAERVKECHEEMDKKFRQIESEHMNVIAYEEKK